MSEQEDGSQERSSAQRASRALGLAKPLPAEYPVAAVCVPTLHDRGLLTESEVAVVDALLAEEGPLASAIDLANSMHLHVKVEDVETLPIRAFFDAGAVLDHRKNGYAKFCFPDGLNAIFSHIRIAQEEALDNDNARRQRPYLDHLGVDLREETPSVRAVFDSIPVIAARLGWGHVAQGGGARVYCCHVSVDSKHWLYPTCGAMAGVPLEFAYGRLVMETGKAGCDLRPSAPSSNSYPVKRCC